MNNLSIIYRHEGKYAQAEALLSAALEIKRRVLGREYPNTLKTMGNLANVYHDEGKYPQAETFFSQMLEIQRRVSGP
ncbi:MAG TPA: tetratricopeptide repeat protein, partial [Bryobacteraceae bacterium]|nr:tetratricopeptide repeat protein [Bryobacteraceae bacterium]